MMKNQLAGLMKQAQQMQENMQRAQEELARTEVEGQSGAGLVRIVMTCRHDVKRVSIDPSLLGQSGKVRVQIWLTDTSSEAISGLKALGVEVTKSELSGKFVLATVDSSKLLEVARLASVRYIAPVR